MKDEQIYKAIEKASPGVVKYLSIMSLLNEVDVSQDQEFQRMYNGFYRVRQRNAEFYKTYFSFMEFAKVEKPSFEKTLKHLYEKLGRIEASFSSKLIATINPSLPIWDSIVLEHLELKKPLTYSKNRISETINLYDKILNWYESYVISQEGKHIVSLFDEKYPESKITDIKKIDFVLWQTRE